MDLLSKDFIDSTDRIENINYTINRKRLVEYYLRKQALEGERYLAEVLADKHFENIGARYGK